MGRHARDAGPDRGGTRRPYPERLPMPKTNNPLLSLIDRKIDVSNFREQHWEGTFWEYLDIVTETPTVSRNAFQRVYDMILTYGSETFTQFKHDLVRYR